MRIVKFFDWQDLNEYIFAGREYINTTFIAEIVINEKHFHIMGAYSIDSPQYEGRWGAPYFFSMSIMIGMKNVQLNYIPYGIKKVLRDYLKENRGL